MKGSAPSSRTSGRSLFRSAAIGVTTAAIAGHFKGIAETEAFNKAQAEGFSDALAEGATAAEAISQHLTEAGKIEFRLFDETQDLGENLAALGLDVDQFSQLAARDAEGIRAWGDAMIAAGADAHDVNLVMLAATKTAENLGGAQKLAAENAKISARKPRRPPGNWIRPPANICSHSRPGNGSRPSRPRRPVKPRRS